MRFINLYLLGYVVLIIGVLLAMWKSGAMQHIQPVWIAIGAVVAIGIGIMLAVGAGKPRPMRRAWACVSYLAVLAVAAGAAQTPAPPPPRTGLIFGQVLDDATGQPIADAMVSLTVASQGGRGGAAPPNAAADTWRRTSGRSRVHRQRRPLRLSRSSRRQRIARRQLTGL